MTVQAMETIGLEPVSTDTVGLRTVARSFELTPRRIMAFAAGVGDVNPAYFDDTRPEGLVGHPGLIFSLQWNARHTPDLRVSLENVRRGVHAWVDARFERALRCGDVITCQGELISVRQVRSGVLSTQRYAMRDSFGKLVVEFDSGGIVRGAVTSGPDRELVSSPPLPEAGDLPDKPIWSAEIPIRPDAAHVYTECADIWNPIHTERSVALAAGLPDIILHGTATLTLAMRELIDRCLGADPARLVRIAGQFRAMVLMGTSVSVRCLEERITLEGAHELFFDVLNHEGESAIARGVCVGRPA